MILSQMSITPTIAEAYFSQIATEFWPACRCQASNGAGMLRGCLG